MVAGQKLVASDRREVMLFPLPYMYISQGEGGSYSHEGILAIDFLGWGESGRVYNAPLYAPCSCKCVAIISGSDNGRVFESLDKVHTPIGLMYVTFLCFHDNNPIANVGDKFKQGELFAHTGTAGNVTGDHTHYNMATGKYLGFSSGQLINSDHIYDLSYINSTEMIEGLDYNWRMYGGGIYSRKKGKFNWVLYARKLRNNKLMFDKIKK